MILGDHPERAEITKTKTLASIRIGQLAENQPPLARPNVIKRFPTQTAKVRLTTLLSNDSDPDGDSLSIVSVTSPTAKGATVYIQNGYALYLPPAGMTESDSFKYTVADDKGAVAEGIVFVDTSDSGDFSSNIIDIRRLPNGNIMITFSGIPGRSYLVQGTARLEEPQWVSYPTALTADDDGIFSFETAPDAEIQFFRSVSSIGVPQ
jgi:hypothetical protein